MHGKSKKIIRTTYKNERLYHCSSFEVHDPTAILSLYKIIKQTKIKRETLN